MARNTFAKPPGPEDAAVVGTRRDIPGDGPGRAANLNAIAVAVNDWRKDQLRTLRDQATTRRNLHGA